MFLLLTFAKESGPRARGWKASFWPRWVSRRNKKIGHNHGQLTQKPSPERFFPLKLLEALRKSGCLLANFARPILVPVPRRDPQVPQTTVALPNLHLFLFQIRAAPLQGPPSTVTTRSWRAGKTVASSPLPPSAAGGALLPLPAQAFLRVPQAAAPATTCPWASPSTRRSGSGRPLQMETVVFAAAWAALLRLRPHSSSMPRAPKE